MDCEYGMRKYLEELHVQTAAAQLMQLDWHYSLSQRWL